MTRMRANRRSRGSVGDPCSAPRRCQGTQPARAALPEEGSGTVLVLAIALSLIAVILAVLLLVQATVGAARAGAAADLAALAAADTLRGLRTGDPCTVAGEVAGRNAAELASCATDLAAQTVTVHVQSRAGKFLPWPPSARARAGPPGG